MQTSRTRVGRPTTSDRRTSTRSKPCPTDNGGMSANSSGDTSFTDRGPSDPFDIRGKEKVRDLTSSVLLLVYSSGISIVWSDCVVSCWFPWFSAAGKSSVPPEGFLRVYFYLLVPR